MVERFLLSICSFTSFTMAFLNSSLSGSLMAACSYIVSGSTDGLNAYNRCSLPMFPSVNTISLALFANLTNIATGIIASTVLVSLLVDS